MKILILGAKGLLGEALQRAFKNYEVIAYDREELDVTNFSLLKSKINDLQPEIIINCVAWNDVDGAEIDIDSAMMLNARVPNELAKIAKNLDAIFIHYSTDHVFDGENPHGYKETDTPNPVNVYGRSKYGGEKAVQEVGGKYYLVRTSRLYGTKPRSAAAKLSFVLMMIELGKKNRELKAVDEEPGAFTYVNDLAAATKKLIENNFSYGIYHLTNSGAVTWFECATEIFSTRGGSALGGKYSDAEIKLIPVSRSEFPRKAKMPKYSILLNTKFTSLRDWKEALHEFLEKHKSGINDG